MTTDKKKKATGYDKYIDWKMFIIPVVLFTIILMMPTPYGMKDVGTEYSLGPTKVVAYMTQALFKSESADAFQWQLLTAHIMEQNLRMGALTKDRFLKRNLKWCKKYKIQADEGSRPAGGGEATIEAVSPQNIKAQRKSKPVHHKGHKGTRRKSNVYCSGIRLNLPMTQYRSRCQSEQG